MRIFFSRSWLDGVLPLVMDRESTLQEKCMETLEEIILSNIVPINRSDQIVVHVSQHVCLLLIGRLVIVYRACLMNLFLDPKMKDITWFGTF